MAEKIVRARIIHFQVRHRLPVCRKTKQKCEAVSHAPNRGSGRTLRNEYDRYSTLDDMKLVVEHDMRQYQRRAECLIVALLSKFSRFSIQDNAKTLSLICTPVARHYKCSISFWDYQVEPYLITFWSMRYSFGEFGTAGKIILIDFKTDTRPSRLHLRLTGQE